MIRRLINAWLRRRWLWEQPLSELDYSQIDARREWMRRHMNISSLRLRPPPAPPWVRRPPPPPAPPAR